MSRPAVRGLPSPVFAALVTPLVAAAALGVAGKVPWADLAGARTALLWIALLAFALVANALLAVRARRAAPALAWLAAAFVVAQLGATASLTVDARLDAGEGEEAPPASWEYRGWAARLPRVRVESLPSRRGDPAVVVVDGVEHRLPVDAERAVGPGVVATVQAVQPAPTFVVRDRAKGVDVDALQVKLRPADTDYFEVGVLPYRFYVTVPPTTGDELAPTPARMYVRVQRGKLMILSREFARAEPARFENMELGWGDGARWAPVRIRSSPRPWLAGTGAVLAAAAAALALRGRTV